MKDFVLQRLTTWLWSAIVLIIVILAVYASFGRLLVTNIARYQDQILEQLNARLSFVLEIDELQGSWVSLTPRLEARGVRILGDDHAPAGLEFGQLMLELDVLDSIRHLSPQLYTLRADGIRVHVDVGEDGVLRLLGMPEGGDATITGRLYDFVFNAEYMKLADIALTLHDEGGEGVSFAEMELRRDGAFRRIKLSLRAPDRRSWFRLTGEGRGELRDLADFEGMFHLESSVGQLAYYSDLLALANLAPEGGVIDSALWLGIDRGDVSLAATVSGREVKLQDLGEEPRSYAFSEVGATARADYRQGQWQFRARDVLVRGAEEGFAIDRLAGEYDGQQLVLRLADLQLGTVSRYLERAGLLPETAASVLGKLSPAGMLERVELSLPDFNDPSDWRLAANFRDLDLKPWKGAPGLTRASGFASLGPRDGRVQLDSSNFSMAFPALYREPLDYSSFRAELAWRVYDDAFQVVSGPFTAQGDEGEVRGLFSLNLPRQEAAAGKEMDLMVSLRDARPQARKKYLPYTLNKGLLDWLEPSIGDGLIRQAGFIYRGSLDKHLPEHRTVQLFFDIEDTRVEYHPRWPALESLDGLVIINGADVDLWSSKARILGSTVKDIGVRLRTDAEKQLRLSVTATMEGSAADGLAVVNGSPLRDTVGDTFIDWELEGELATQLQLQLNLSNLKEAPQVELSADWIDVDVAMVPLDLSLKNVAGRLNYETESGFSAQGLTGSFWGEPFVGAVSQGRGKQGLNDLDIQMQSSVSVAALRDWLQLDLLQLAQGQTDVDLHVLVPSGGVAAGKSPRLEASTDLQGVSLDLPTPWAKTPAQSRSLAVEMPLAGGARTIQFDLEGEAFLAVLMDAQGFRGGSLGFGEAIAAEEPGRFLLGGELGFLDWDEWLDFTDTYLGADEGSDLGVYAAIRSLKVEDMRLLDLEFDQVTLSGDQLEDSWHFDAATSWSDGSIKMPEDLSRIDISLNELDLVGFNAFLEQDLESIGEGDLEMPVFDVSIENLREGDAEWGSLLFQLAQIDGKYEFSDIRGNLRGLQLGNEDAGLALSWLRSDAGERTELKGSISFLNFGDVLKQYQYEEIVETNSGRVNLDLAWPGAPTDYALVNAAGVVGLDVDEGRFLKTSGAAEGTLRVVGILNLAAFVQRLSLDLSYAFQSGIPFDSITGEFNLEDGLIEVPQIEVAGRSSSFEFVGVANVRESSIDGELVATLPIASNLPWIAALVSGLPAAAGVYVISKLFTKQMDRFSSAIYRVQGPWDDPEVNFQRIFDDSAEQSELLTADNPEPVTSKEEVPET